MINSTYNPPNSNEFEKAKLNKMAIGFTFTPDNNASTNFDYLVTDDILMTGGGALYVKNSTQGDYVDFQVLAPVGGGVYAVANQFITSWYINPDVTSQVVPKAMYPAKIFAGLKLRIVYTSVGGNTQPWCAINFDFEKVIV